MNEKVRGDHRNEAPQWLVFAMAVFPPLSLVVALLVYFAQVRESAYARALGFNSSLLEEASIPAYLVDSAGAVFFPLLVAVIGLLAWLVVDVVLRRWARAPTHVQVISRVSWVLPLSGTILVLASLLIRKLSSAAQPYISLALPFLFTLAVLAAAYGASLRRLIAQDASREGHSSHRWAINGLTGLLVTLLLFWGVDGFAQAVGRGHAQRVIEKPNQYTRSIVLYSAQDLHLDPPTVTKQKLPGDDQSAYGYRYEGLRLVLVNDDHYFLIGKTWRSRNGTIIALPRDGVRIEFPRGTA